MDNRPRIVDTETGQFWSIATFEDLKETLLLMERAASGVVFGKETVRLASPSVECLTMTYRLLYSLQQL